MDKSYDTIIRILENDNVYGLERDCNNLISTLEEEYLFVELTDSKLVYNDSDKVYVMTLVFDVGKRMTA